MTSREFSERVKRRARKADVQLGEPLLSGLESYYRLLETWNNRINLTALDLNRDPDNAVDRLLIEPLVAVKHLDEGVGSVIDIGSGGGSPAIPMKLARPLVSFTLVEAKTRKCAFLREAGRHLGIELRVETARFEMLLTRPELHAAFDACTLRAVRVEPKVLVGLQAFLRAGGQFLLFRGPAAAEVHATLTPLLVPKGTFPLVEASRSRLMVLEKR
jgi:16S rRNA (guanine(527)-N(7))-methyltransferase RsmG